MAASIDSNKSSGYYQEEVSLKVPGANAPLYAIEPNSYSDFGGDLKSVAREPINATRSRAKGTITDIDVAGGWNEDFTQNNMSRLLQGFLFAQARCKPTNKPLYLHGWEGGVVVSAGTGYQPFSYQVSCTAATGFARAAGSFITDGWKVGHIIKSRGFVNASNNFTWYVTAVTALLLTVAPIDSISDENGDLVTSAVVAEAAGAGVVEVVGIHMIAGTGLSGQNGGVVTLAQTSFDFTTLGFIPGEWIYLGDNGFPAINQTGNNFNAEWGIIRGFCRIKTIAAHAMTFDIAVLENYGAADVCTEGGVVNLYYGTVIQNESTPSSIIRRTYSLFRTLGQDVENNDVLETINGAVPNMFTLNVPSNSKLAADLTFVAMDTEMVEGDPSGHLQQPLNEEPYNTSEDVYSMLLYIINAASSQQTPLFGYATDEKLVVNNNVKPNKAIGVIGGFEASVGMFDVSGSLTCYFDDPAAIQAIRNNANVGLVNIFSKKNQGMIFDLPLLTLGGGRLKVEKDKPITTDVTHTAAAGANETTLLYNKFEYLPSAAMTDYAPTAADTYNTNNE